MPVYNISPMFEPQYVAAAAAALVFATPGAPTAVPASYNYQITSLHVANVTASPVSLTLWRVPSGGTAINATLVTPSINIPVASQTMPHIDLTALWGAVLKTGDAIFAVAGTASALVIHGDGMVITL